MTSGCLLKRLQFPQEQGPPQGGFVALQPVGLGLQKEQSIRWELEGERLHGLPREAMVSDQKGRV